MSLMERAKKLIRKKRGKTCAAVIVAAGTASRMQGIDKIMADLLGEPVICRTIREFQQCDAVSEIVIVTREDLIPPMQTLYTRYGFEKVRKIVAGGGTRTESVLNGLRHIEADLAAIHDGARPLVTQEIITAAIDKAVDAGAAAPAIPVKDTIKTAENRVVVKTLDRSTLRAIQTPQVFDADLLRGALHHCLKQGVTLTDDCSAMEYIGMRVHLTEGSEENLKITTPLDMKLAEMILKEREKSCG